MGKPLLSVCLITYNHGRYIRKALDSVLSQKVNFNWEIIIADDFSTDDTRNILLEYKRLKPELIKLLFQEKNIGPGKNFQHLLNYPKSRYIAYLEGDDFWTDNYKLQKQVAFLDKRKDAKGCFHNALFIDEHDNIIHKIYNSDKLLNKKYTQKQCLLDLKSAYASCTLVFKREILDDYMPKKMINNICDEFLDLLITKNGTLYYLDFNGAAYRFHNQGIWSNTNSFQKSIIGFNRAKLLYSISDFKSKYKEILKMRIFKSVNEFIFSNAIRRKVRLKYFLNSLKYLDFYQDETYGFIKNFLFSFVFKKKINNN